MYSITDSASRKMTPEIWINRISSTAETNSYYQTDSFDSEDDDYLSAVLHMKTIEMLALIKGTSPQEAYLMESLYDMDSDDEEGSEENEDPFYYVECFDEVNDEDVDNTRVMDWHTAHTSAVEEGIFGIEL